MSETSLSPDVPNIMAVTNCIALGGSTRYESASDPAFRSISGSSAIVTEMHIFRSIAIHSRLMPTRSKRGCILLGTLDSCSCLT